jgi:hypothetical protein
MSSENPNPSDDIMVQCQNKACDWFGQPKFFPSSLNMAEGEHILCGGCFIETRFIGDNRPTRTLPFDPATMNLAGPNGQLALNLQQSEVQ